MSGGFDWDDANIGHIDLKRVDPEEAEEALLDPDRIAAASYSTPALRRRAVLGSTETGSVLYVVYIRRNDLTRVVSARDAEPDERASYRARQRRR